MSFKPVALAVDGGQVFAADFFAQGDNVGVHGAGSRSNLIAPDLLQEFFAGDYAALAGDKKAQQFKF